MARLPIPGGDGGSWGTILNDFLSEAHTTTGAIKPNAVSTSTIANNAVSAGKLSSGVGSSGQLLSTDGTNLTWTTPTSATVDATTTNKGVVQLAGDLSGTATSPTVPGLATKANSGANTDITSLSNLTTPLSTSQGGTGSASKNFVDLTTPQSVSGVKTFSSAPVVPSASFPESAIVNLTSDLANKVTVDNGGGETFFNAGNSGAAITLNLTNGNVQRVTLTANTTLSLTAPASGTYRGLLLHVFQDANGNRTITWPVSVKWGIAGAPILTSTANKMDMIHLSTVDGGVTWYGVPGAQGF